jgi:5'-3' exoribonuclease 2
MAAGRFSCSVTLSDGNNPGEGEHKILPRVRALREQEPDKTVVIYSPDGDMISLALMTQKSHIYIMRFADPMSEHENGLLEKGFELLYCSMDMVRNDFFKQMTRTYSGSVDPERVLLDYNFLLAMVGNDFVPSLPFLKIRSGGLDLLLDLYNRLRPSFNDYLVGLPCLVHPGFFKAILLELSKMENAEMRKEYSMLMREYHGSENQRRAAREALMSPKEKLESRYYHLSMFHPDHPLASTYRRHHDAIDYRKEKHAWKAQYYKYFCDFHPEDFKRYNRERTTLVMNYLESLMFTLRYYTQGCPSWTWCYKHRVAPLPSDVHTVLETSGADMNRLVFEKGVPYTPFQQLLMILPPESMSMLPTKLRTVPTSSRWSFLYPREFEVDALAGNKYIYSEAILPENTEEESFLRHVRLLETQLSPKDQARNIISTKVRKFVKV